MYRVRVGEDAPPLVLFLTHICCCDLFTVFCPCSSVAISSFLSPASLHITVFPLSFTSFLTSQRLNLPLASSAFPAPSFCPSFVSSVCIDLCWSSIDNSSSSLHKDRFHLSKTFHYCSIKLHESLNKNRLITVLRYRFLFKDTPLLVAPFNTSAGEILLKFLNN